MKREFKAAESPLENGFSVIEASAGTGKTTTIATIVLRLLTERGIPIEQILVTTYTELATAELRGRIRETIADALTQRRLPFVEEIVSRASNRKELERRLRIALQSFDEAPIFTIHGFCARVLADRAFEGAAPFETELVTDQSRFLNEIADDFWRTHFYRDDAITAGLLRERLSPARLVELLQQLTNNPTLRVSPPVKDRSALEKKIAEVCRENDAPERLTELGERLVISFESEFCGWAPAELDRRKKKRRVQSFDDMLSRLEQALLGQRGSQLQKSLRERFAVALVDEFQDTDPVQYSIFSRIYAASNAPVFFIGDPKQAIYGFRGADVFTYLKAADSAHRRYTLNRNWRSEAKLVEGVNALFDRRKPSFVIENIDLAPVTASGRADEECFNVAGRRDPPLHFWIASRDDRRRIGKVIASEIVSLLVGDANIGGRKIRANDIAILVNNNTHPPGIQRELADYGIPSVVYSAASVLKSGEASELLRVLLAVAQPTRVEVVRAGLATEIFGFDANTLENLSCDEAAWESRLNRFADYHQLWREQGFVQMMRALVIGERVRSRFLGWHDGERRLTNFLHLIELLHAVCVENRLGIDGVITWLRRQISGVGDAREEHELRLESDEDAVRIVTIHKSKGLEYSITFCPFLRKEPWRGGREFLKFHQDEEFILDLEELPNHKKIQRREELAEMVRQLYVALTRAKHRSYLIWQENNRKSKSALAWLFSDEGSADNFLEKKGESNTSSRVGKALVGSDSITIQDLPESGGTIYVLPTRMEARWAPRIFEGEIDWSWRISSFSSLISGRTEQPETPDYDRLDDAVDLVEEQDPAMEGIHAFPGGMRAGTCLHLILEELDFADLSQLRELVTTKLNDFHFEGFEEVVCETVERTLRVPLGEDGFTLSEISRRSRLSELAFTFPLTTLTTAGLRKAFQLDELPLAVDRLQFGPVNGLMKGFIDLVFEREGRFYIVDWKSNRLGMDSASYVPESIAAEMARNFYNLQLGIYALALHRYLQRRLAGYDYEKNFGGCLYIFLRGVDPKKPRNGIFAGRPPRKFLERLDKVFHGKF